MTQQALISALTPREVEILTMIAEGYSLAEIAHRLCRSLKTIESHRLSIGRKLKASNRVELARIAIAEGLVSVMPDAKFDQATLTSEDSTLELQWLSEINEAVCFVAGHRYLDELCNALSRVLDIRFAAVCIDQATIKEYDRFVVSMSERGHSLPTMHYEMKTTPVSRVLKDGRYRVDDGLSELYPNIAFVREFGLRSYVAIRLTEELGGCDGVLALMDDKPLVKPEVVQRVMRFFLARTATELDRIYRAEELAELRKQLAKHSSSDRVSSELSPAVQRFDRINQIMTHRTGIRMLSELTEALCDTFEVRYSGVCVSNASKGVYEHMAVALSESGYRLDPVKYPVTGSPCELVVKDGYYAINDRVAEVFPEDRWLSDLGLESYFGIRLEGAGNKYLGVMWLIDNKPQPDTDRIEKTLRYLAPRISAEIQTLMELDRHREQNDKIEVRHNRSQDPKEFV